MSVRYDPYYERTPDEQYRGLLRRIRDTGIEVLPQQEERARMVIGHMMRFPLLNGFPIITERDIVSPQPNSKRSIFEMAIAELVAFLNGARTQAELKSYGCSWWSRWLTTEKCAKRGLAPGDNGPGSYGAVWRNFPTAEGSGFDQITHIIEQIRELPHLRTHYVSPWAPQHIGRGTRSNGEKKQQGVVVAPCHGWIHVLVHPVHRTLTLHHFQRSGDVPVGIAGNIVQYAALTMMIAQVTGYVAEELVYTISDAHIYERQLGDVGDLLGTQPQRFPTVRIDPSITNIFDFRPEHFSVTDYHPKLRPRSIWTPV